MSFVWFEGFKTIAFRSVCTEIITFVKTKKVLYQESLEKLKWYKSNRPVTYKKIATWSVLI